MGWKEKREQLLAEAQERKAMLKQQRIERFETMEPFNTIDDIPDIPIMENKDDRGTWTCRDRSPHSR